MFYIVSTPIGNLGDISLRALEVLKNVDFIACEDTRKTQILLKKYEIKTRTFSYHVHSSDSKVANIKKILSEGKDIALVSDAGTPGINDPGTRLIKELRKENFEISVIPGSSAFLSALSLSGFSTNVFTFLGFIPNKKGRQKFINNINNITNTVVFYESSHRIIKCLKEVSDLLTGDRRVAVVREITKIYEESVILEVEEINDFIEDYKARGEYVVVVSELHKCGKISGKML